MNKYIQRLICEQFNIGNMDLSKNKQKRNTNIFNKYVVNPTVVYNNITDQQIINIDDIKQLNDVVSVFKVNDKDALKSVIRYYAKNYPEESLNWLDISQITDMSWLFSEKNYDYECRYYYEYNGDISKWDVSNVTDMSCMFTGSFGEIKNKFNRDISGWDVSNVTNMFSMFETSDFNQDISHWNVSNVQYMSYMFSDTPFNYDISGWDVSHVTDMHDMFKYTIFNHDISGWDVSHVVDMEEMFAYSHFNQDISGWNVSNVTNMTGMFNNNKKFNQDISGWDVSNVDEYWDIFYLCLIKEKYKPEKFRE